MAEVATFDFHVTSECSQECAYCWGPMDIPAVDALLRQTDFDAPRHQRHAEGWNRSDDGAPASPAE